jgi:hypothetical protein
MNGMTSNPPPLMCPNGLFAAVTVIKTASVAKAAMKARRRLTRLATEYRARMGAIRMAPLTSPSSE